MERTREQWLEVTRQITIELAEEEVMRQDEIDRQLAAEKIGNRPDAWTAGDDDPGVPNPLM